MVVDVLDERTTAFPTTSKRVVDLTEVGRYHLRVAFLVPRGEVVDPEIQVEVLDEAPRVLRLS